MSISGEINRIRSEVNTQTDLISQIRSALNGKVAGGGESAEPILQDKTLTANGTYTADSGYDGFGTVTVNVPTPTVKLQEKTATANGEVVPDGGYDGLSKVTVNVPSSGGGGSGDSTVEPEEKEVNFYDYDGTRLYSYTLTEINSLTSLPPLPTQQGLTCQGWNYTLEELKTLNRETDVGATYITQDGKTRIYVSLPEGYTSPIVGLCPNGTVTVDWGDGTTSTLTGTSATTAKYTSAHAYAQPGDYVITLSTNGTYGLGGHSSLTIGPYILRYATNGNGANYTYRTFINKIELGANITTLGTHTFRHCANLKSITIPNGITAIGDSTFAYCVNLKGVVIPKGVTTVGSAALRSVSSAKMVSFPLGITSVGEYVLAETDTMTRVTFPGGITLIPRYSITGSVNLRNVIIPNSVTSIASYALTNGYNIRGMVYPKGLVSVEAAAFSNSYAIILHDFSACEQVPTLANTSAFTGITSQCKIFVPAALYNEWVAATNWSTYASYIVAV